MPPPMAEGKLVVDWIKDNGYFDEIRKKVIDCLKNDEGLKSHAMHLLEDSNTLANVELSQVNKKKVLDDLRRELESELLNKACMIAMEIMTKPDDEPGGISSFIDEKVHEALCKIYEDRAEHQAQAQTRHAAANTGNLAISNLAPQ